MSKSEVVRQVYADNIMAVVPGISTEVASQLATIAQDALERYPYSLPQAVQWAVDYSFVSWATEDTGRERVRLTAQWTVVVYAALFREDPLHAKGGLFASTA